MFRIIPSIRAFLTSVGALAILLAIVGTSHAAPTTPTPTPTPSGCWVEPSGEALSGDLALMPPSSMRVDCADIPRYSDAEALRDAQTINVAFRKPSSSSPNRGQCSAAATILTAYVRGKHIEEDFSYLGMSTSTAKYNDAIAHAFYAANPGIDWSTADPHIVVTSLADQAMACPPASTK